MAENVCIIIAAYNASATIQRAIASALAEPQVAEVIVVDDASQDDTVTVALLADDGSQRLTVLQQPQNTGPSAARNRAIRMSGAPWIGVLDADDFFIPGRIGRMLDEAARYPQPVDLIADNMWQVDEADITGPRQSLPAQPVTTTKLIGFIDFIRGNISDTQDRSELGFLKPLMRREFLETHGIAYREDMRLGEDFDLYARALALGATMIQVPVQHYVSVVRPDSLSSQHSPEDLLRLRDCLAELHQNLAPQARQALQQHSRSVDCRLQWRLLIQAVNDRKPVAALKTFLRPFPVPQYLAKQLMREVYLRSFFTRQQRHRLRIVASKGRTPVHPSHAGGSVVSTHIPADRAGARARSDRG